MAEHLAPPSNLPSYATSFIGREREILEILHELRTTKQLTFTGTPGSGKTRLAREVVDRLMGPLPDGVWWCDLAGITDPAHVPQAVASALHLTEGPSRSLWDTVLEAVGARRAVLVLDNCEHLLSACGQLAQELLSRCPNLALLATSLQPLGLTHEKVWSVPPLPLPEPGDPSTGEVASVRLFVDRARLVTTSFHPTPETWPIVAAICRRLDGLPLAIELAAARVRMLTVEQIDERLDDALGLLTRSSFDLSPRHRTLRATLDWTYRLLTDAEQGFLRSLSVFAGAFTLDMAEVVCGQGAVGPDEGGAALAPATVLDLLTSLVDKSLLQLPPRDGAPVARYRLPEVIRQHARSALEASGEAGTVRTRHLTWALTLAEQADAHWVGPDRAVWLDRLDLDHDDVRAALRWARTSRQGTAALRLAREMWRLWFTRGHWSEGRSWCEELLALDDELGHEAPPLLRADVLYRAGTFAFRHHDLEVAARHLEESAALYRTTGPKTLPSSLNVLALIAQLQGDPPRAIQLYEEALAISRSFDDRWVVGVTLVNLGGCLREQADYARAAQCFKELAPFADLADLAAHAAGQMGAMAAAQGDYDRSLALLEDAIHEFERLGDRDSLAVALEEAGRLAVDHAQWDMADRMMRESLQVSEAIASSFRITYATLGLAHIARERREFERADDLYGQSLKRSQELDDPFGTGLVLHGLGLLELARGRPALCAERLRTALERLRAAARPLEITAAMEDLALALAEAGQVHPASRLIAAAAAWRAAHGAPIPPLARRRYERAVEIVHLAVGAEVSRLLESPAGAPKWEEVLDEASRTTPAAPEPGPAPRLRASALGPSRVLVEERPLTPPDWKYLKARELFFYLLSVPPASKERIGVDLWPDAPPSQLRSTFHRTMHHVRRALGDSEWIRFEAGAYAVVHSPDLWYDVEAFGTELAAARRALTPGATLTARSQAIHHLEAALQLYRGDFLADLDVGEWAILLREDLRRRSLEARMTLGGLHFADARYANAADVYRELIAIDPYLEAAHRELMRCLARLGETGQAVRHYQTVSRLLYEELDTQPAPETSLLYERLRRGDDV
jgi:non-specific serine/threonine protein kinase